LTDFLSGFGVIVKGVFDSIRALRALAPASLDRAEKVKMNLKTKIFRKLGGLERLANAIVLRSAIALGSRKQKSRGERLHPEGEFNGSQTVCGDPKRNL
jgi:hypothetical protein